MMPKFEWPIFLILLFVIVRADENPFQCRILYEFNATLATPRGDVYSPFYGEKNYPDGLWCEYRITGLKGYRFKLTFKDLDIQPSEYCNHDSLTVYANEKEYVIVQACGTEKPDPIITNPEVEVVRLLFITDFMVSGRGFHLHYEVSPRFEYCSNGLKECTNHRCYNETTQRCDGNDDCGDGSDEENCSYPLADSECGNPSIQPDTVYDAPDRIVGGQEVVPNSWPWQVSIQNNWLHGNSHSCGGALINAQWVLTAGHCVTNYVQPEDWRIHLGKHHKFIKDPMEQIRYGARIITWPNKTGNQVFGYNDMVNDIALMKMNAPVQFSDGVRPVCLPTQDFIVVPGTQCYTTGWGETRGTGSSDALKQTDVTIMPNWNCTFEEGTQICVRNLRGLHSTCHGDSGGPLSCKLGDRWHVMGLTSFGSITNFMSGLCAQPLEKTVFARISSKADWIRRMINSYS